MLYFGIHPAFTNLLALGPVLALWLTELWQALTAARFPGNGKLTV